MSEPITANAAKPAPKPKPKKRPMNPVMKKRRNQKWLRIFIQLVFFIAAPSAYSSAFSGIKEIGTEFSTGAVLEWTSFASILVFLLVFTVVFGRFFCGYACAFGAVGDWVYFISEALQKKLRKKKKVFSIPSKVLRRLQYIKYLVLLVIFIMCVKGMQSAIGSNSPWTVFSFLSGFNAVPAGMGVGIALLVLIVVGMALQERFFCQVLCPMGAVFSLLPVLPFGQLHRDRENCAKGCRACTTTCPVDLELDDESPKSGECIRCGRCSGICPKKNVRIAASGLQGNETLLTIVQSAALLIGILIV